MTEQRCMKSNSHLISDYGPLETAGLERHRAVRAKDMVLSSSTHTENE